MPSSDGIKLIFSRISRDFQSLSTEIENPKSILLNDLPPLMILRIKCGTGESKMNEN